MWVFNLVGRVLSIFMCIIDFWEMICSSQSIAKEKKREKRKKSILLNLFFSIVAILLGLDKDEWELIINFANKIKSGIYGANSILAGLDWLEWLVIISFVFFLVFELINYIYFHCSKKENYSDHRRYGDEKRKKK